MLDTTLVEVKDDSIEGQTYIDLEIGDFIELIKRHESKTVFRYKSYRESFFTLLFEGHIIRAKADNSRSWPEFIKKFNKMSEAGFIEYSDYDEAREYGISSYKDYKEFIESGFIEELKSRFKRRSRY